MTNPGEQQPIIDGVPGIPSFDESQQPNAGIVPIAPENVTPAMMNHAINSPYNKLAEGELQLPAPVEDVSSKALEGAGVVVETDTVPTTSQTGPRNGHAYMPATAPSQQQIDNAAKFGFDLSKQDKYYPYASAKPNAES